MSLAGLKKGQVTISVTDIKLAASLMALGISPVPGEEVTLVTGDAKHLSFNFLPYHVLGSISNIGANEIIAAWKQERAATSREEEWSYQHPEHPLSYLMCAWDNYLTIMSYVRNAKAAVYLKKGKSVALIDVDRTPKYMEDFILGRMGV